MFYSRNLIQVEGDQLTLGLQAEFASNLNICADAKSTSWMKEVKQIGTNSKAARRSSSKIQWAPWTFFIPIRRSPPGKIKWPQSLIRSPTHLRVGPKRLQRRSWEKAHQVDRNLCPEAKLDNGRDKYGKWLRSQRKVGVMLRNLPAHF